MAARKKKYPSHKETARILIAHYASSLEQAELDLVVWLCSRLLMGQRQYGPLENNLDKKEFAKESIEEGIDNIVYLVAQLMKFRKEGIK